MRLRNNFLQGKLNRDLDERLLQKGQYPDALNIRVSNSDASDVGVVQNVQGNERLTNLGLSNGKAIGSYADHSNQKLYWFVTSDETDFVFEYDYTNTQLNVLLASNKPSSILNFNKDYLITGVSKVINGDSTRDMLIWTDNLNGIRKINIERAKTYSVDGFIEDDISLIKRPPIAAPTVDLTFSTDTTENSIEDKFLSFSYRYKYLDGEYSALSSYTNYKFSPSEFDLDYQTMENLGMVNAFSAVNIGFNTGDKRVTDIQLVVKESNSNALAIIETFKKSDEGWGDNETQSFKFANSKKYIYLPEKELFRAFDNVPRVAKAMELVNNRLVFGNYTEGFDLKNIFGEEIVIDFDLTLLSKDLSGEPLPLSYEMTTSSQDTVDINLTGKELIKNSRITIDVTLKEITYDNGNYEKIFTYILNREYADATALATDPDFIFFIENVMSDHFKSNYTAVAPPDGTVDSITGFEIVSYTSTTIKIKCPTIIYQIDDTPLITTDSVFHNETSFWEYDSSQTNAFFRKIAIASSLKTNRSYEVGIIYLDDYNRASTVITCKDNTIRVPQKYSVNQNTIVANIHHQAPADAKRYKMVVKQNKAEYQTIYTNVFYEDGLFRWVKLEGANKDKVQEGDTLIVKSDLGGVLQNVVKVRVLEISQKASDFIVGNKTAAGDDIIEEEGLYMKIKPVGFAMDFNDATARSFVGGTHYRFPIRTYTTPEFGTRDTLGVFTPYALTAGSSVHIFIQFEAFGNIAYKATYDKRFRVNGDYTSVKDWFDAEVVDLGQFGVDFTWDGVTDIGSNICAGFGLADSKHRFSGWGFGHDCVGSSTVSAETPERFFVVPHRKGTASRGISTTVKFDIVFSEGTVIFETEPQDTDNNIFYETEQTFDIIDGYHQGNLQNQSSSESTAIIELDSFNCYVQGNGAESFRYKDDFNTHFLNIDLRPSATSVEKFRVVRRFADLTYSEPFNENTNLNGLNEFNLATLNFKEDIDKRYGFIQKLYAKDTDMVVFQEDKVSKVLFGKDLLFNADETTNLSGVQDILGRQIMYSGEYGISRNPESFAFRGNNIYFTDAKRGCVCRLGNDGIVEISMAGMINFFKEQYKGNLDTKKYGAYDPYYDQYVLHNSTDSPVVLAKMNCGDSYTKNGFTGVIELTIDYGVYIGMAGLNYSTNGVPIRFTIIYDDDTIETTEFFGDTIYNSQLIELGYDPIVTSTVSGLLQFDKDKSSPNIAKFIIEAPICDTNIHIDGLCINKAPLTIVNVIINDLEDKGLTAKNRYRWSNATYSSPFKTYDSDFTEAEINLYEFIDDFEGTLNIPLTGSTVEMQAYLGSGQTAQFLDGNRLGFMITNTLFEEDNLDGLLSSAGFTTPTITTGVSGDVTAKISFTFNRPSNEQYLYLIWDYRNPSIVINPDTKIYIMADSSGSMDSSLTPIQTMKDTLLKSRLLPLYNNDPALYDANVQYIENPTERTFDILNIGGATPSGNVVAMFFQDEANPIYHSTVISPRTAQFDTDMAVLQGRLNSFTNNYYRGVIFQVTNEAAFKSLIQAVQLGTAPYDGVHGLSTRDEFNYKYDITNGGTPEYYLDKIVEALQELGYEL